jgi:hypothetical protein
MDNYLKCRVVNSCSQGLVVFIQGLEEFSAFHFFTHIEGNKGDLIINESIETDTLAGGVCWLVWRVAQGVMNFIDDCIYVNTLIIEVIETLEGNNSSTI